MRSHIILTLTAIAFALPTLANAATYSCPPAKDGKKLNSLEVFDGPVADEASLIPDNSNQTSGTWTFDEENFKGGRFITLRCKYVGGAMVDIEMKDKIKACKSKTSAKVLSVNCN